MLRDELNEAQLRIQEKIEGALKYLTERNTCEEVVERAQKLIEEENLDHSVMPEIKVPCIRDGGEPHVHFFMMALKLLLLDRGMNGTEKQPET